MDDARRCASASAPPISITSRSVTAWKRGLAIAFASERPRRSMRCRGAVRQRCRSPEADRVPGALSETTVAHSRWKRATAFSSNWLVIEDLDGDRAPVVPICCRQWQRRTHPALAEGGEHAETARRSRCRGAGLCRAGRSARRRTSQSSARRLRSVCTGHSGAHASARSVVTKTAARVDPDRPASGARRLEGDLGREAPGCASLGLLEVGIASTGD